MRTQAHYDEPLCVLEFNDFSEVVRALQHAAAEGLGVQVWNFQRAGCRCLSQAWTVELYEDTPLVGPAPARA
jgi:hypothetical protein